MATLKFKTNAKCGGCVAAIGAKLNKLVKEDAWSIDLKSPDKTLTITTDLPAETILSAVSEAGSRLVPCCRSDRMDEKTKTDSW